MVSHRERLWPARRNRDTARLLNKAEEGGFFNFFFMQRDFFLDPVRDDPGIQRVLEPDRAQHEAFAATFCSECWPMSVWHAPKPGQRLIVRI